MLGLLAVGLPRPGLAQEAPALPPGEKTIMAGDRLRITVEEDRGLTSTYTVAGDGTIDFGYIGRLTIADLSVPEAERKLKQILEERYFRSATVSMQVAEFVEGSILITGAGANPGEIPFRGDQMLTLMEAITMRGGLASRASGSEVRILRWRLGGGLERQIITVNVARMLETLDFTEDQYLRPRDLIYVPHLSGEGLAEFLALGEVSRPGFHPHRRGLDVIRAVTAFGGVTSAAKLDSVKLLRPQGDGQYTALDVNLAALLGAADMRHNFEVRPGDIFFVPNEAQASRGSAFLLGEIGRKGPIPLPIRGETSLARTILASGPDRFSNLSRVRVMRTAFDGSRQTLEVDVQNILDTGNFDLDVPILDGDVIMVPARVFRP